MEESVKKAKKVRSSGVVGRPPVGGYGTKTGRICVRLPMSWIETIKRERSGEITSVIRGSLFDYFASRGWKIPCEIGKHQSAENVEVL
jgi:hypothetical protein